MNSTTRLHSSCVHVKFKNTKQGNFYLYKSKAGQTLDRSSFQTIRMVSLRFFLGGVGAGRWLIWEHLDNSSQAAFWAWGQPWRRRFCLEERIERSLICTGYCLTFASNSLYWPLSLLACCCTATKSQSCTISPNWFASFVGGGHLKIWA